MTFIVHLNSFILFVLFTYLFIMHLIYFKFYIFLFYLLPLLILFIYSHTDTETHHDFTLYSLSHFRDSVSGLRDKWCYNSNTEKTFGFLSRLAVGQFSADLWVTLGQGVFTKATDAFLSCYLSLYSFMPFSAL